jgi:hypothetical protein
MLRPHVHLVLLHRKLDFRYRPGRLQPKDVPVQLRVAHRVMLPTHPCQSEATEKPEEPPWFWRRRSGNCCSGDVLAVQGGSVRGEDSILSAVRHFVGDVKGRLRVLSDAQDGAKRRRSHGEGIARPGRCDRRTATAAARRGAAHQDHAAEAKPPARLRGEKIHFLQEGAWEWRFPTTSAPRYLGSPGRMADADRVAQDVADGPMPVRIAFAVSVRDALDGRLPESPSHGLPTAVRGIVLGT